MAGELKSGSGNIENAKACSITSQQLLLYSFPGPTKCKHVSKTNLPHIKLVKRLNKRFGAIVHVTHL